MNHVLPSPPPIRFGVFELDQQTGELRKQGVKVRLQEQPFQILRILLEHPGKVVTREELRQRIWPSDTFVDFNQGLYNATKKLREALGDSAESPRFIETLSRRGYRFIAALDPNGSTAQPGETLPEPATRIEARGSRGSRIIVLLVVSATMLVVTGFSLGGVWRRLFGTSAIPQIRSIAVLPLENLSGDPGQEYFSDGMTDALITDLAQVRSLKVISRTSSMQYKSTKKSLPVIARELNVDGIIEGTVQRSGDRVRITAQLIHGPTDKHIWANSYERETRDVFALERDVTDDIGRQVQARLDATDPRELAQPRIVDPKVLEAYVQGNYHLSGRGRGAGDDEPKRAREYFQRAIDLDSTFAPAYIGLAESHDVLSQGAPEDLAIVRRLAEKAVELDPTSSDAHAELAQAMREAWDWRGWEEECRRAIALNPNNGDARDNLGTILDVTGRLDEGWKEFQIAQELDPKHDHLADPLDERGQVDQAIEIRHRIATRDPLDGYNHYAMAMYYAEKQMFKEFASEMGQATTLFGLPGVGGRLQRAYDQSGGKGTLRQWARELEQLAAAKRLYMPGALAQIYAALGEKDRAFYWLEQFGQHHDLSLADPVIYFKTDPWLASLRSDPRFGEFLHRIGLPP